MNETVRLYDAENIHSLEWPKCENGAYAQRFLTPIVRDGIKHYIDNIHAEVKVLKHNEIVLPITIVNGSYGISHVCSPYDHYISHALESMHFIKNKFLNQLLKSLTLGFGQVLKWGKINQVILVNNWFFSTDLYPKELPEDSLKDIVAHLQLKYPKHAVVFRSINSSTNPLIIHGLKAINSHLIVSRQVYLSDTKNEAIFKTRIVKSDLKLLRESQYEVVDGQQLTSEELVQILELYKMLYIDKYSDLHPNLNMHFIGLMIKNNLLTVKALKKNNVIDGVVGYFTRNGVMMSPFFGYDQKKSQHSELYRLLSTILMLEAKEKNMVLHQGAGASFYKKLRRAESHLEYMAVFSDHLPFHQKATWRFLKEVMNRIAIQFMIKY